MGKLRVVQTRGRRITRREAPRTQPDALEPVLIRYSRDGDQAALERLAALDSRQPPAGRVLLAEIDGELVAAASLDPDAEPLGDPFRPTATVRELLRLRRRQIQQSAGAVTFIKARRALREAT